MLIERPLIAPLLRDHEMAGIVERLCEGEILAAGLFASPSLGGTHQISDLLAARDLGVDVADHDDHRSPKRSVTPRWRGSPARALTIALLPIALNGVWIACRGMAGVLAGIAQCASLAQ